MKHCSVLWLTQQFPKDPDQFLHNQRFYIKLKVSTTSYLSLQRAPSSGSQSEDELVNDPQGGVNSSPFPAVTFNSQL